MKMSKEHRAKISAALKARHALIAKAAKANGKDRAWPGVGHAVEPSGEPEVLPLVDETPHERDRNVDEFAEFLVSVWRAMKRLP